MVLSVSVLYLLSVNQLRRVCSERGLSCIGPVRVLRRRLADYLKSHKMEQDGDREDTQASESVDVLDPNEGSPPPGLGKEPQVVVQLIRPTSLLTCCGRSPRCRNNRRISCGWGKYMI
jgi:hypothetical protein